MRENAAWLSPAFFVLAISCAPLLALLMSPLSVAATPTPKSVTKKVDRQLREYDLDHNGMITPDEFRKAPLFRQVDTDRDGRVTRAELETYYMDIYTKRHMGGERASNTLYTTSRARSSPVELTWHEIDHQGYKRFYGVATPSSAMPRSGKRALLVSFHGHHGDPQGHANATQLQRSCDEGAGCIVVFPASCKETAKPGDSCRGGEDARWQRSHRKGPIVDDPGFVAKMLENLLNEPRLNIEPGEVYATGASNGGAFVYFLYCSNAYPFKKYNSYMGNPHDASCRPARPASIFHIHGDEDAIVPFRWSYMDRAARLNRCTLPARQASAETTSSGLSVSRYAYRCAHGAEFKVAILHGAGHRASPEEVEIYKGLLFEEFFGDQR